MKGYIRIDEVENGYTVTDLLDPCHRNIKHYIADGRWQALTRVAILLGFGKPRYAVDRVRDWLRQKKG